MFNTDPVVVKAAWEAYLAEGNYSVLQALLAEHRYSLTKRDWETYQLEKIEACFLKVGIALPIPEIKKAPITKPVIFGDPWYPFAALSVPE